MNAILLCIGDEILSGITPDTNSSFIATELKKIGIGVQKILTVSDELSEIVKAYQEAFEQVDLVISTGGLGPTNDDNTLEAMAKYYGTEIRKDPAILAHLKQLLEKRNRLYLLDLNQNQALSLEKGEVILNLYGTASVQLMDQNRKVAIALPGVPYEMKALLKESILPYLISRFKRTHLVSRFVSVVGIPESQLSFKIADWENSLPSHLSLSYLPLGNRIKLHLKGVSPNKENLEQELQKQIDSLKRLLGSHILSEHGNEIEEIVRDLLARKNLTISVAESCTGGQISKLLVTEPGISEYYYGGIVAYTIEQKEKILGLNSNLIDTHGVVSKEVARAMSEGVQKLFGTDIALSTTGTAGPLGDENHTEVGEVFISVRVKEKERTSRLFLPHFERKDFMNYVAQRALQYLVEMILEEEKL